MASNFVKSNENAKILKVYLTLSLTAMYLEPISSLSALVAASKSSKRLTSDCNILDSSFNPGDAILESTGEIDLVTMSRIFVGTVGLFAPGSPFKCWSSNLCGKITPKMLIIRFQSHQDKYIYTTVRTWDHFVRTSRSHVSTPKL